MNAGATATLAYIARDRRYVVHGEPSTYRGTTETGHHRFEEAGREILISPGWLGRMLEEGRIVPDGADPRAQGPRAVS